MTGVMLSLDEGKGQREHCHVKAGLITSKSQGNQRTACSHHKLQEARKDSSVEPSRGSLALPHLDLRLLASRVPRE